MDKGKVKDLIANTLLATASVTTIFILCVIFYFVISRGFSLLSWDLVTKDYHSQNYVAQISSSAQEEYDVSSFDDENTFASSRYGLVLEQSNDLAGDSIIKVLYVADNSPFTKMTNLDNSKSNISLEAGDVLSRITYVNHPSSLTSKGAERMISDLENPEYEIFEVNFASEGGGIAGSIKTTIILILLTLLLALPMGVFSAIYFNEFASDNRFTRLLRSLVETLTGVPSIIFGLLGISVFVPLTIRFTPATNTNLIAGALTLSVILLPTIIRVSEESLRVVSDEHRFASLALGANKTQTTFKVVLPQALSGILTATFLGIGRIIGESAALIFVLGAAVKDQISIWEPSTSLAVHIWSIMSDEPPNIALSSSIALIILMIVLVLNVAIKLMTSYLMKRGTS